MLDLLAQLLCWIKQFGALVLGALISGVNLVIAGIGGAGQAIVSGWPIGMPALPEAPGQLGEAMAWVKWSPLPVSAGFAFLMFACSVWIAWLAAGTLLRWAKVIE